jgi:hypothetical protein
MRNLLATIILALFFIQAEGREVAGVELPESVELKGSAAPLVLNGAGIRKKFFFSVYLASLYLPAATDRAESILAKDTANRVQMDMLYSEVEKKKLVAAWNDGFAANHASEALVPLQERIEQFNGMFETLVSGDQVQLDYLPGQGTRVVINGTERGVIPGADFNRALLKIWLGESPVTSSLKEDLLGG